MVTWIDPFTQDVPPPPPTIHCWPMTFSHFIVAQKIGGWGVKLCTSDVLTCFCVSVCVCGNAVSPVLQNGRVYTLQVIISTFISLVTKPCCQQVVIRVLFNSCLQKLRCFLDGGPHKPVTLTLTGSCTGIPPIKEVQNFSTQVRGRDVKMISIPNRTNQHWELTPVIEGEYWSGPVTFSVEPQQSKQYELVYRPLTMTNENKKHQVRN